MKLIKIALSLFFILLLTGCFSTQTYTYNKALSPHQLITQAQYNNQNISQAFIEYYKQWQGVQYKYAGTNKQGVDCSYFVQNAYKEALNIKLPRTTQYQIKSGVKVTDFKTGDLVFFNTGYKTRHVGIYLSKGHFMHVSTSKGVIISRLDNPYWNTHYLTTKRIIP